MFSLTFVLLLPVLQSIVSAYSNPNPCSGSCNTHDPSLIQRASDGKWFVFSTGGHVGIATADNLDGPWTAAGQALSADSIISNSGSNDLWAPDVTNIGGTYYMYYAVSTFGTQTSVIGLATSTTLEAGSWVDHGTAGIGSNAGTSKYNAIDPALLVVSSSEYYLSFGSFWSDIYQVKMSSTPTKPSGTSTQLSFNATGTHAQEGSYIYHSSTTNYYYLLLSSGICCAYTATYPAAGQEYRIIMGRSTSPTGPFVDEKGIDLKAGGGSTLLASHGTVYGPGGQGVYTGSADAGDVLYYHYANTTVGVEGDHYFFGWNKLSYVNGWPSV